MHILAETNTGSSPASSSSDNVCLAQRTWSERSRMTGSRWHEQHLSKVRVSKVGISPFGSRLGDDRPEDCRAVRRAERKTTLLQH